MRRDEVGSGMPEEIQAGLTTLSAAATVWRLLEDAASERSLTCDGVVNNYIGVRPAVHGVIPAYVHAQYVDLMLPPERARGMRDRFDWKIVKSNPTTAVLRVPAEALDEPHAFEVVRELALQAIDKSEAGTPFEGGKRNAAPAQQQVEICPVHFQAMLGGVCDLCE